MPDANEPSIFLTLDGVSTDLQVLGFIGREALNQPFRFDIDLVSSRPDLKLENLLHATGRFSFGATGKGLIHGQVCRVEQGDSSKKLTRYSVSLVPQLAYLQHNFDQQIFQQLSVPKIIAQVLEARGILADAYRFQLRATYPEREYCVQYGESDLHFIQRLCEEEGIHFHFQHSASGHTLVFGDDQTVFRKLAPVSYRQDSGMVAEKPLIKQFNLRVQAQTPCTVEGRGDEPTLLTGHFLPLTDHPRAEWNDLWLLQEVIHEGKQPQVLGENLTSDVTDNKDGFYQGYRNHFLATPWDAHYRPALAHKKTMDMASQSAIVTGPAGEEIHCDQYGRVKVQFHWDREGQADDKTSCWLRVATGWAGNRYGGIALPRIGMEVLVTFMEGDPDQPLIMGCLYHKENPVPYPLPAHKTRTVFKTLSSPGGKGYNELRIEDKKGAEQIYLHARRDWDEHIGHDQNIHVGNERHDTVEANVFSEFKAEEQRITHLDRKTEVRADDHLNVGATQHVRVGTAQCVETGRELYYYAGDKVVIDAGMELTARTDGGFVKVDAGGITLSGAQMKVATPPLAMAEELEEEEEEVEQEHITLRIGVFFDGTGNNRSNSERVSGCFAQDVGLADSAEDIRKFCAAYGYDGKGSSPDNSYGNDTSNVAKLYDLYMDQQDNILSVDAKTANLAIYVEGIGTRSIGEDSPYSQGTGLGAQGVRARVKETPALFIKAIRAFQENNPDKKVELIEFNIFGFSRGAAAARNFANEVLKGEQSILAKALPTGAPILAGNFKWQAKKDVLINFIGIYDTVAAIANPLRLDFNGHNANNPGINIVLAPDTAKKVVHLVAKNERRYNFSLKDSLK